MDTNDMTETVQTAVAYVVEAFRDPSGFAESPLDDVATHLGSENYQEVDPYEVLEQAMDELGYDEATQEAVMAAATANATAEATATATATAEGGYSIEELAGIFAEGIKVTIDNSETINQIDNSLYVEGDVKGGIHQANYTEVSNVDVDAAEGAIAAGGNIQGQQQTGDGTQIDDTYAEDITTGDYNTSADDGGIVGNENVQADVIQDSEFGEGDKYDDESHTDNSDHSTNDSFNTDNYESFNTKESFNEDYTHKQSDDDYVNVEVDTGYGHDEHYEPPVVEEHGYEPVAEVYETEDHYEEPADDYVDD